MAAKDAHYLLKLREVRAMAFVSELYLRASLERKGIPCRTLSGGLSQRNDTYLGWLTIEQDEAQQMRFAWKPVPTAQYKYPITRYYSDNFSFMKKELAGR